MRRALSVLLLALLMGASLAGQIRQPGIVIQDGPNLDPFSRLRSGQPGTLFDSNSVYDANSLTWDTTLAGAGAVAHQSLISAVRLSVGAASGDRAVYQSHQYWPYQSGRGQLVFMTGTIGGTEANQAKRLGYYDDLNGIYLEQTTDGISVVTRSNTSGAVVDNPVAQASWNLDPLNGSGKSGITLDLTKAQILAIDLQWLGVGRVRVGFDIGGSVVYAHQFLNANNVLAVVYMQQASLPTRYEIINTGASSGSILDAICVTVIREGGTDDQQGLDFSASMGATPLTVTVRQPILSIRPKLLFATKPNRSFIRVRELILMAIDNPVLWELVYNGTLGGGTAFASVNANSTMESDIASTTIAGGTVVASGYIPAATAAGNRPVPGSASQSITGRVTIAIDAAGAVADRLSVVVTSTAANSDVLAALNWAEIK